jgi:hypothetical protein
MMCCIFRTKTRDAHGATIHVEITTIEGVAVKLQLPPSATVLLVKQEVESKLGIKPRDACVLSMNEARSERLQDKETIDSLFVVGEAKLELSLLVEQADAQQVVPELSAEPSMVLGGGTEGDGDTQVQVLAPASKSTVPTPCTVAMWKDFGSDNFSTVTSFFSLPLSSDAATAALGVNYLSFVEQGYLRTVVQLTVICRAWKNVCRAMVSRLVCSGETLGTTKPDLGLVIAPYNCSLCRVSLERW